MIGTRINELSTETRKALTDVRGVRRPDTVRCPGQVTPAPGRDFLKSPAVNFPSFSISTPTMMLGACLALQHPDSDCPSSLPVLPGTGDEQRVAFSTDIVW